MRDNVFCYKCDKIFSVEYDEYYDTPEEVTFTIIHCPHCKIPNSIYYSTSIKFHATEPTEKDKEDLRTDLEDEKYEGGRDVN